MNSEQHREKGRQLDLVIADVVRAIEEQGREAADRLAKERLDQWCRTWAKASGSNVEPDCG